MVKELRFNDLSRRHVGLTDEIAANYAQAARVCFSRHHSSPQTIQVTDGPIELNSKVEWARADDRTRNAWANEDDATRDGAYGIALAAIELTRGLVAVSRAESQSGADYYLGEPGVPIDDLETKFRLEVSGTDEGNDAVMRRRLREKILQARRGRSSLPALASVVGFQALKVMASEVE